MTIIFCDMCKPFISTLEQKISVAQYKICDKELALVFYNSAKIDRKQPYNLLISQLYGLFYNRAEPGVYITKEPLSFIRL